MQSTNESARTMNGEVAPIRDARGAVEEKVVARPVEFGQLAPGAASHPAGNNMNILLDIALPVAVELGRGKLTVKEALSLAPGSVVELDKLAGQPLDILLNDRLIAHGEVVVVGDSFGVRIVDIVSAAARAESLV